MAGYSGTPLIKKLGIKEGFVCCLRNAPVGFKRELGTLPAKTSFVRNSGALDFILFFCKSTKSLPAEFSFSVSLLKPAGMVWVAWPKKSSGVQTDLSFDVVQRAGLDAGLVDVKICAINDVWSGLKFVYRLRDRKHVYI
jgi:hypothetical protein